MQVNRSVSFNLSDPDQRADYEYSLEWFSFSGKVKELIRAARLQKDVPIGAYYLDTDVTNQSSHEIPHGMTEQDALDTLI